MIKEADWTRFDFWAIVACRGLVTVGVSDGPRCRAWLANNNYNIHTLNFGDGISTAVENLGELLNWQDQFRYRLSPNSRNLDALRDGFLEGPLAKHGASVLEIDGVEQAWKEDPQWLRAFLSIAQEESLIELALGKRFFSVVLIQSSLSPLVGAELDSPTIEVRTRGGTNMLAHAPELARAAERAGQCGVPQKQARVRWMAWMGLFEITTLRRRRTSMKRSAQQSANKLSGARPLIVSLCCFNGC